MAIAQRIADHDDGLPRRPDRRGPDECEQSCRQHSDERAAWKYAFD